MLSIGKKRERIETISLFYFLIKYSFSIVTQYVTIILYIYSIVNIQVFCLCMVYLWELVYSFLSRDGMKCIKSEKSRSFTILYTILEHILTKFSKQNPPNSWRAVELILVFYRSTYTTYQVLLFFSVEHKTCLRNLFSEEFSFQYSRDDSENMFPHESLVLRS